MAKIFSEQAELNNHPNRNNFDLSHKIHMSGKMGLLYPVFCKPVVPGDSFRIDSGCAFNFMPMPYPTQTRMRFVQHFFYVRNKNLWKNWENWLEGLPSNDTGETPVPPYIDQPASFFKTGSLADFLGIPTTYQQMESVSLKSFTLLKSAISDDPYNNAGVVGFPLYKFGSIQDLDIAKMQREDLLGKFLDGNVLEYDYALGFASTNINSPLQTGQRFSFNLAVDGASIQFPTSPVYMRPRSPLRLRVVAVKQQWSPLELNNVGQFEQMLDGDVATNREVFDLGFTPLGSVFVASDGRTIGMSFTLSDSQVEAINSIDNAYGQLNLLFFPYGDQMSPDGSTTIRQDYFTFTPSSLSQHLSLDLSFVSAASGYTTSGTESGMVDIADFPSVNPYYSSANQDTDTVRLSALPFRAYESIYNAFYRNTNGNQPFTIDGRVQYNKYNTTTDDGADSTDYHLFNRNWELDAYTSCLPSPQQGAAPVVGISALGEVTITDPETGVTTTARATDTPNGMQISDVNLGDQTHQRYLVNLATSGITINDFRNVNSLQRFLETNIRKGYRYVDFIEGHFGVKIKGAILDMPEFIGGFSQSVDVNMVTNTTAGEKAGIETLGDYGGQASAFGGTKHSINHFCDDYGFIVGIMCLVPEPTYSQILPKHFNIKQPLDYYFPEFSQIGMQPITYEELCPVQSHYQHSVDPNIRLTDVFGYQRPNHDMVWFPDTLHGEFRKSFNRYIVNRVYSERPELGEDFLIIKPEETNSIFNYTAPDADVFLGQVAFDVKAKRPVPRIVIPSLGR